MRASAASPASDQTRKNADQTGRPAATEASLSKERLRLWLRLLKVSSMVEVQLRAKLRAEFGSTLPRFDVLAALDRAEQGLRMSDLSKVLRVSNGSVTVVIDRLVDDCFVKRMPVQGDRRAMMVDLTPAGRVHFAELARVHEGWVNDLLGSVDMEQAHTLRVLLGGVAQNLEASRSETSSKEN